jgi:AcrR family transcriptional regulator
MMGDTSGVGSHVRARRTQKERRDETQGVILEAAVSCLLELGYARTSTTEVQRRAGVSRGALLHHFPAKAQLLAATVRHLAYLRGRELKERAARLPGGGDRVSAVLDLLWESFSGPLFEVAMELRSAARTDEELREVLAAEERQLRRNIMAQSRQLFGPAIADQVGFAAALDAALQMMIGAAATGVLHREHERIQSLVDRLKGWFPLLLAHPHVHANVQGDSDER